MRRAVIVFGTTAAGLAALFSYKTHVAGVAVASTSPSVTISPTPSRGTSLAGSASARPSPSKAATRKPAPKPSHSAPSSAPKTSAPAGKSGTFSGPVENTQYGEVQVSITVSNGKITNANGSLPQGGDSIAQNAIGQLNPEVLTAQSAKIQAVSGATYTSKGYIGSLQQALNEAGL
jgi:uncharacterized protein with FMN-binding domain